MRKLIFAFLIVVFCGGRCFALSDNFTTSNTVTFSAVARIVTLNSVTNWLRFENNSETMDCFVDLRCMTVTDNTGAIKTSAITRSRALLRVPAKMTSKIYARTSNIVEVNYSTKFFGLIGESGKYGSVDGTDSITYTVTGDHGSF